MTPQPEKTWWAFTIDNYILLILGAIAALIWANVSHGSYERFAHILHFPVGDIGMVFFFGLAAKEIIEATLPGGPLASPREAAVPLLAAVGGMVAPATLYVLLASMTGHEDLLRGWAIPCATDIAFSYMAARAIFPKSHPAIPFLLLLAVADDALGLVLLAAFYPSGPISLLWFAALMIPAIGVSLWLRSQRVRSFWPYVVFGGGLSWAAFFYGGFHPALALVPILPCMPHAPRDLGLFLPEEHGLPDTLNQFEHWWQAPVQVILLFFGLANAGVAFSSVGDGTWIVLAALVAGKPLGIVLAVVLSVAAGLRAPGGLRLADTAVVGILAGVGFTVALFFATASFPAGETLDQVKMGAVFSFAAVPVAWVIARVVGISKAAPSAGSHSSP